MEKKDTLRHIKFNDKKIDQMIDTLASIYVKNLIDGVDKAFDDDTIVTERSTMYSFLVTPAAYIIQGLEAP